MPKRSKKYEESLLESLQDPVEAAAYLNAHLEDEEDNEEVFLLALRDVAKAHGFSSLAEKSKLGRESLYKSLSEAGNPKLTTLRTILDSVGLKFNIEPKKKTGT